MGGSPALGTACRAAIEERAQLVAIAAWEASRHPHPMYGRRSFDGFGGHGLQRHEVISALREATGDLSASARGPDTP